MRADAMSGSTIQSLANAKSGESACRRCNGWGHPPGDKNIPCYSCGATGIEPSRKADAMSDDTEKLLRAAPTVSKLLERFTGAVVARAREEAIEECAQVADKYRAREVASQIRALAKLTPPTD